MGLYRGNPVNGKNHRQSRSMRWPPLHSRLAYPGQRELLAAGESREQILADYPYLEAEDITAALLYAARQFDHPVLKAA